ncbi:uncharacterized protein VDAG_10434 [Verticillium dahliae VdLs.17]|uniref:Uncharacterized protein n=1 Tax=Verticillium dahliae (strain VdLs.17 / ATCC MYA-4575 / FGSC 10137) TaxID=498257 RepID=G2XJV2_VERDV|nr:uncharacterized protein VDAG_10434 [Verticillium dahliae VdLs.17]EGY20805.1 hypothetical protein VDAG_10434 [Verticillium dahliae VdLs.17]KAH6703341.1 Rpp14/Pop5 family-domain-containing protein [Verticillium dahliae]
MVRIKERYLLVNILYPLDTTRRTDSNVPAFVRRHRPTPGDLLPRDLVKGIRQQVSALFGDYGSGAFEGNNLVVKYFSKATSTFILKVKRAHYRLVWAALTTINSLPLSSGNEKSCVFSVVRVSGTIRKVEEAAVHQARQLVLAVRAEEASDTRLPTMLEQPTTLERPTTARSLRDRKGEIPIMLPSTSCNDDSDELELAERLNSS